MSQTDQELLTDMRRMLEDPNPRAIVAAGMGLLVAIEEFAQGTPEEKRAALLILKRARELMDLAAVRTHTGAGPG